MSIFLKLISLVTSFVAKLFSRSRAGSRAQLRSRRWCRPVLEQLEERVVPAVFGTLNTIDHDLLIPALTSSDQVKVEIASNTSFDTFSLNGGNLGGQLELSFLNGFTLTLGQSYQVL